jgi:hypothetical protein
MSSGSETTPPSQIHHRFTTDLLEIYPSAREHNRQKLREFRILSDVLSDLDIRTGDVLEMTATVPGYTPGPQAIVAVSFIWSGVLLLRQFVPPRMLITNSSKGGLPHVLLGRSFKIVAQFEPGSRECNEGFEDRHSVR